MESNGPNGPAFAVVHDVAATWDDYPAIRRAFADASVEGLILHAAGPTDDGFRTIDVWRSQNSWHLHRASLGHILTHLHVPTSMRELRIDHLMTTPPLADMDAATNPRSKPREH
jgi:hypothetical protein